MNPLVWLSANPLYIWLAVFVVAFIFEIATPSALVSLWFAIGALASMGVCALKLSAPIQVIVFVIISLICLFTIRPLATNMLRGERIGTGAERLIGRRYRLLKEINESQNGEIKINDVLWKVKSAKKYIKEGTLVEIMAIDGAKLIVRPIEEE